MTIDSHTAASDRRSVITAGAAGIAGAVLGASAVPTTAHAAAGDAMRVGRGNDAGTSSTLLDSRAPAATLTVVNRATGPAVNAQSTTSTGFAGGTAGAAAWGVSAANKSGATGKGGAIAAGGGRNDGIVTSTGNEDRYALKAIAPDLGMGAGAAIYAKGGGQAAVVAEVTDFNVPGLLTNSDVVLEGGAVFTVVPAGEDGAVFFGALSALPTASYTGSAELIGGPPGSTSVRPCSGPTSPRPTCSSLPAPARCRTCGRTS